MLDPSHRQVFLLPPAIKIGDYEIAEVNPTSETAFPDKRPPDVLCAACEQASHGGEIARSVESGGITRKHVTELGLVLAGKAEGRRSATDITLFDSTGLAIQDLAIAIAAYSKAGELDLQTIDV